MSIPLHWCAGDRCEVVDDFGCGGRGRVVEARTIWPGVVWLVVHMDDGRVVGTSSRFVQLLPLSSSALDTSG